MRRGRADGAAGGDNLLDAEAEKKPAVLRRVFFNGLPAAGAVRHPPGVSEVYNILRRKLFEKLPHDGQPATAGVTHADGAVIHGMTILSPGGKKRPPSGPSLSGPHGPLLYLEERNQWFIIPYSKKECNRTGRIFSR